MTDMLVVPELGGATAVTIPTGSPAITGTAMVVPVAWTQQATLRWQTPRWSEEPDLGDQFAEWADESLEWANATFDAQAETWPER